jgi:hypothetical protein
MENIEKFPFLYCKFEFFFARNEEIDKLLFSLTSEFFFCEKIIFFVNFQLTCKYKKIILNSITFAPLAWKLWNDKCAHHLVKGFLVVSKVEWGGSHNLEGLQHVHKP